MPHKKHPFPIYGSECSILCERGDDYNRGVPSVSGFFRKRQKSNRKAT
jgi:hypothetical protein